MVWVDERDGNRNIYGNGINATTGARLLVSDVVLANTTQPEDYPAIAYGSGNYQVVYGHNDVSIRTARVNGTTGLLIDTNKLVSERPDQYPDIDFNGTNFLVVAQRMPATTTDIVGTFISTANVVGSTFWIETAATDQSFPRVRWNGTNFIVAYQDNRNLGTSGVDIYARQVTSAGVPGAAYAVANSVEHELRPVIAHRTGALDEVTYWRGPVTTTFDYSVWGQSLNNGALSGAPFAISNVAGIREMTSVIACNTSLSCVVPYRWFNPSDTATSADRIKARVLSY